MVKPAFLLIITAILAVSLSATPSINALGTTLPPLSSATNYRVFNDLMKQSLPLVPYQKASWGSIGRYWGYNLAYIDGLSQNFPSSLPTNVYAVA
jgi:hypothetical protein